MTNTDINQWIDTARTRIDQTRAQAADVDIEVQRFTREKPWAAVLCAFTGGYVLARLFSMRLR
jgi:ElaB/YqjD/DUF883 family membrane-anchored ribosome-binding protein